MGDETSIKALFQGMIPENMGIIKGRVISDNPLEIQVLNDEKLILKKNNICLPRHLTNYTATVDIVLGEGESAGTIDSVTKTGQGTHPHGDSGEHPHGESGEHPHGSSGTHPHGDSGEHEHILSGGDHEHITPEGAVGGGNHDHEISGGSHSHPASEGAHEHPDTEGKHKHPGTEGKHSHPKEEGAHVHNVASFNIRKATMTVYNALKIGDIVYILSFNDGKKYYVLDREGEFGEDIGAIKLMYGSIGNYTQYQNLYASLGGPSGLSGGTIYIPTIGPNATSAEITQVIKILQEQLDIINIGLGKATNRIKTTKDDKEKQTLEKIKKSYEDAKRALEKAIENANKALTVAESASLTEVQKIFVSTISAEAQDTFNYVGAQAVAHIIINRANGDINKVFEVISAPYQFSGYLDNNYNACMQYLNNRDGKNTNYENIINNVIPIYLGKVSDITNGCTMYYSPRSMVPPGSTPPWNFSILEEVFVAGIDDPWYFRFYRNK